MANHDDPNHEHNMDCFMEVSAAELRKSLAESNDRDEIERILLQLNFAGSGLKIKYHEAKNFVKQITPVIDEIDKMHAVATARSKELAEASNATNETSSILNRLSFDLGKGKAA